MRGSLINLHKPAARVHQDRVLGILLDPFLEYLEILAMSDPCVSLIDIDALGP